jgi:hypothetical protein
MLWVVRLRLTRSIWHLGLSEGEGWKSEVVLQCVNGMEERESTYA